MARDEEHSVGGRAGSGERAFVSGLADFFGCPVDGKNADPVGIGDDGAVLRFGDRDVVMTCDPVVEGQHFEWATATPRQVGRKAVLRNLSDLAAMAATPTHLLLSVLLPRQTQDVDRDALFEGVRDAAREHGVRVVGGDTGSTDGPLTLTVTAVGVLDGPALLRSAGRAGDRLYVSGALGGSMQRQRHLEPCPQIALARRLAREGARAAMDISDGLAIDLSRMVEASSSLDVPLAAQLRRAALPVHADAVLAAGTSGRDAVEHALYDGEDYELLFTWPSALPFPEGLSGCVEIGLLVAQSELVPEPRRPAALRGAGWIEWVDGDGRYLEEVAVRGYEHDV